MPILACIAAPFAAKRVTMIVIRPQPDAMPMQEST